MPEIQQTVVFVSTPWASISGFLTFLAVHWCQRARDGQHCMPDTVVPGVVVPGVWGGGGHGTDPSGTLWYGSGPPYTLVLLCFWLFLPVLPCIWRFFCLFCRVFGCISGVFPCFGCISGVFPLFWLYSRVLAVFPGFWLYSWLRYRGGGLAEVQGWWPG